MSEGLRLNYVKTCIFKAVQAFAKCLDDASTYYFPSQVPHETVTLLKRVLDVTTAKVHSSTDERFLVVTFYFIQYLSNLVQFVDNSKTKDTPRGLVLILKELTSQLNSSPPILAAYQNEYNYSILDLVDLLKKVCKNLLTEEELAPIVGQYQAGFKLIRFPKLEKDNILLHVIIGHELGHPIADAFLTQEEAGAQYKKEFQAAANTLEQHIKQNKPGISPIELVVTKQELLNRVTKIRNRGMQELISDCVCAYIFGSSALFAMYDILSLSELDTLPRPNDYYPPNRYRFRVIKELLESTGQIEALRKLSSNGVEACFGIPVNNYLTHIEQLVIDQSDLQRIEADPIIKIAYGWIARSIAAGRDYGREAVNKVIFEAKVAEQEIPHLLKRLMNNLPPNEHGQFHSRVTANWRSAILSSWIYKIASTYVEKAAQEIPPRINLQSLTLAAIEYIVLAANYSKQVENKGG